MRTFKFYLPALLVMLFVASAPALAQQGARRNNTVTSRQETKAERKQEKVNEVQKPTNVVNQPVTDNKMRTAGGSQSDRRNGSDKSGSAAHSGSSGSGVNSGNSGSGSGSGGSVNSGGNRPPANGGYGNGSGNGNSSGGSVNSGGNRPPANGGYGNGSGNGNNSGGYGNNSGGNRPPANGGYGNGSGNGNSSGGYGNNSGGNRPPANGGYGNGSGSGNRPPANGGYGNGHYGNYPGGYNDIYPGVRPPMPHERVYDRAETVYRTNKSSIVVKTLFRTKAEAYYYVTKLLEESFYTVGSYGDGYSWLMSDVSFIPTPYDWTNPMTHNQFRIKATFTKSFGYVKVTLSGEWRESILSDVFSILRFQPSDRYSTYYAWNVLEDLADSIPHSHLSYR